MLISELINNLEKIKEKHGDIFCVAERYTSLYSLKEAHIEIIEDTNILDDDSIIMGVKECLLIG